MRKRTTERETEGQWWGWGKDKEEKKGREGRRGNVEKETSK